MTVAALLLTSGCSLLTPLGGLDEGGDEDASATSLPTSDAGSGDGAPGTSSSSSGGDPSSQPDTGGPPGSSSNGDADASPPSRSAMAGTWQGTWTSKTSVSGGLTFQLGEAGAGTASFTSYVCLSSANATFQLTGFSAKGTATNGVTVLGYDGTLSGATIAGTYTATAGNGGCGQDNGSFEMTRL